MLKSSFVRFLFGLLTLMPTFAAAQNRAAADSVLVLPFENTSGLPEYNWVGESFADGLSDLFARLEAKGTKLRSVSNDQRKINQQSLRLPLTALPSLATSIKLARTSSANLLVVGKYNVKPEAADGEGNKIATSVSVKVSIVDVRDGTYFLDRCSGSPVRRIIDIGVPLSQLQVLQGQVAYQVLYQQECNTLTLPQNAIVDFASQIPPRSFEAYVKGMLTSETDVTRANYLKNAVKLYADEKNNEVYAQAALELGHFYRRQATLKGDADKEAKQTDLGTAVDYFSRLKPGDSYYPEAAFYAALLQWNLGNRESAVNALRTSIESSRLITAYNNFGAMIWQTALDDKKTAEKSEVNEEGLKFLQQSAESAAPEEIVPRFNYGYALFLAGRYTDAARLLGDVVKAKQRDGQAYFLLSKAYERGGDAAAATAQGEQAKRFLQINNEYAKLQQEWDTAKTTTKIPFRLYNEFSRNEYLNATRQAEPIAESIDEIAGLLEAARKFYNEGRDEQALEELRKVSIKDSMAAEAYLIRGKIYLRRGELETAVSNLKTAIFWKNDLIEGHIALGKIFVDRNDFQQATVYAKSAKQIDPNNPEAIALERQIERRSK